MSDTRRTKHYALRNPLDVYGRKSNLNASSSLRNPTTRFEFAASFISLLVESASDVCMAVCSKSGRWVGDNSQLCTPNFGTA